jgi:Fe-S-cluster containining protein
LKRKIYPQEKNKEWLAILLDAHAICDEETLKDLGKECKKSGRKTACRSGCDNCCKNPDIPILEIELRGLIWYATDILEKKIKAALIPRLRNFSDMAECPFLVNHRCSVYDIRPIACRTLFVFNTECGISENVMETRISEVFLNENLKTGKIVANRILDFKRFNLNSDREKSEAIKNGIILASTTPMHKIDWKKIADDFFV